MMSENEIWAEIKTLERLLEVLPVESKFYSVASIRIETYHTVLNGLSEPMNTGKKPMLPIIEVS